MTKSPTITLSELLYITKKKNKKTHIRIYPLNKLYNQPKVILLFLIFKGAFRFAEMAAERDYPKYSQKGRATGRLLLLLLIKNNKNLLNQSNLISRSPQLLCVSIHHLCGKI